uniref:Secreted protein n=1 Tax=Tetradesmus obliquus TaxID=3088 RepID=A0A383VGK1_TETOB|eukprot:jgi/Sobl393_1/8357/SZX64685.1
MKGWTLNFSLLVLFAAAVAIAQGPGRGFGPGMGMGGGGLMMGGGPNSGQGGDYAQVFHALLSAHQSIKRTVQPTNKGISSLTESNNPRVARLIQLHVEQMRQLLEGCGNGQCPSQPRFWDPLFAAVYRNAHKIDMEVEPATKGVKVAETGNDPQSVQLVQMHAAVVSSFVKNGMAEMHQSHAAPPGA